MGQIKILEFVLGRFALGILVNLFLDLCSNKVLFCRLTFCALCGCSLYSYSGVEINAPKLAAKKWKRLLEEHNINSRRFDKDFRLERVQRRGK